MHIGQKSQDKLLLELHTSLANMCYEFFVVPKGAIFGAHLFLLKLCVILQHHPLIGFKLPSTRW